MQNNEDYKHILDISSLDLVINRYQTEAREEEKRLIFLEKKKSDKNSQLIYYSQNLILLKKEVTNLEKELFKTDSQIEKNKKSISETGSNHQLELLEKSLAKSESDKSQFEEKILNLLMEIEDTEALINDCKVFLSGVEETIGEITLEVRNINSKNRSEIEKLESQIEGLLQSVSPTIKNVFQSTRKEFRFDTPISKLISLSCSKCRFTMSRSDSDDIEIKDNFKICSGCARMIISSRHF